jgi:hypothetical protein
MKRNGQKIAIVMGRNLRGAARDMVERPITKDWYYAVLRERGVVSDCRGGWADRAECELDAKDHWPGGAALA